MGLPIEKLLAADLSEDFYLAAILILGWFILLLISFVVVGKLQPSLSCRRFDHHYSVLKDALDAVQQTASTLS
jgi:hypothetical protein